MAWKMKGGGGEFRRSEMTSCVVRRPYPLAGYSHQVGIHLAVGILVVENRYRIGPGSDASKFAERMPMRKEPS
jgi:hypothetical protein